MRRPAKASVAVMLDELLEGLKPEDGEIKGDEGDEEESEVEDNDGRPIVGDNPKTRQEREKEQKFKQHVSAPWLCGHTRQICEKCYLALAVVFPSCNCS